MIRILLLAITLAVAIACSHSLPHPQTVTSLPRAQAPDVPGLDLPPEVIDAIKLYKSNTILTWKHFATLHEAALFGAARLVQCSKFYECAGYIVKDKDGKYVVSPVRTDYASDHVHVPEHNPAETTRVADFHSHPCLPEHVTGKFSPDDVIESISDRVTAYMVDFCTGDVHEFIPGIDKPGQVFDTDADIWMTVGTIVGHIDPVKDVDLTAHTGV